MIPDIWNVDSLLPQLSRWEHIYSTLRPHQGFGHIAAARVPRALKISTKERRVSLIMPTSTKCYPN